ncbi:MAG: M23 family metallopeptidase [Clostridia bacterium]|nr:M23 family metallopeptidase [Clostridia bacterium]
MKRIFIAVLIFIVLCTASAVFFVAVTQSGLFANSLTLYPNNDRAYEVPAEERLLDSVLKSSDRLVDKPAEMNEILYLEVEYILGISMDYRIYFNPLTGEACIEKGLVSDKYYSIENGFLDSIESGKYTITNMNRQQAAQLAKNEYIEFRDNLVPTDYWPEEDGSSHAYSLNAFLPNGAIWEYIILADFEGNQYYVKTPNGTFASMPENMTAILSSDPIFSDMTEETQPVPELVLKAGFNLIPQSVFVDWTKIKPNGQTSNIRFTETNQNTIEIPEPGTRFAIIYGNGDLIDESIILTLNEYRDGVEFNSYNLHKDEVTIPYFEGLLEYSLKAEFPDGTLVYDYEIEMSIPAVAVCPYPEARPGNTLAFFVRYADTDESFSLNSNIGNFSAQLMPYGDVLLGLVPINWWTSPGNYSVEIFRNINDEKSLFTEFDIKILPDDFEVTYQQLVVSDELAKKADPVNTANDAVMIAKAKATSNETSYLDGTFILPLDGEFGTSYAQTRYINGENPYRHSGLDIDGDTGDPIVACNDGVVVMAAELVRTGNTIIIDHGMWLFSSYLHMSAFDVEVGDFVKKGDLIGKVGSTGFSTGPHLHWSVTLNGNYMSPLWLVNNPVVPQ